MGASGIEAQLGLAEEADYNTPVTVTRFHEFVSEGLKFEQKRIDSKGLRAGRRTIHRWAPGTQKVSGPITMELAPGGLGLLLKHAIGGGTTAGAGPFEHTFIPASRDGESLTLQLGRPSIDGTLNPFTYSGVKIPSWSLKASIDEYVMLTLNTYGAAEESDGNVIPLAEAVYPADDDPFIFSEATITIGGDTECFTEIELNYETAMKTDRYFMCPGSGRVPDEPLDNGDIVVGGSLSGDFDNLALYNIYKTNVEVPLVLTFENSTGLSLVFTLNVRFDGENANVEGPELLEESIPFMVVSEVSDAAAFTAVLTNNDAAL